MILQEKLKAGQPGDEYEQEVDRVVDQVMRMPEPQNASSDNFRIQRACPKCEEEELRRQPIKEEEDEEKLQRQTIKEEEDEEKLQAKSSYEMPCPESIENQIGRRILGHELTHVIQQMGNDLKQVRRQTPGHAANPAPRSRNDMINQARLGAWLRCHRAYERLAGIEPPPPPGRPDPAQEWRRRARSLARTIFREDLNMDQVTDIVESMRNRLSPGLTSVRAPPNDPECGDLRDAYVVGNRPPVHLCPRFFISSKTDNDRITTMIHESAHMAGIGEGSGNEYCFYVDCDTDPGCGGFNFADSWTQFVLCLSR